MRLSRRALLGGGVLTAPAIRRARAADAAPIRIGVLNDQSGPYRDDDGPDRYGLRPAGGEGFRDFGKTGIGRNCGADHQKKPDVGASIVRQWFDRDGVDAIVDVAARQSGSRAITL
ncbi:MAG: hypothetical protein QM757_20005 [Paludibaculum sp.]